MPTLADRFWAKVQRGEPHECWPWIGARDRDGYGQFKILGVQHGAHRIAWMLHSESSAPPARPLEVMHSCDNPPCVNAAHLSVGTHRQNLADMAKRGRAPRGSKHHNAKLSEEIVREILRRVAAGETRRAIGAAMGINENLVSQVATRRIWRHITL